MKRILLFFSLYAFLAASMIGCNSGGESGDTRSVSGQDAKIAFEMNMSSFLRDVAGSNASAPALSAASSEQLIVGKLLVTNVDTDDEQEFSWSIYLNEETFEVTSNRTIILPPASYSFSLLLTKGSQQYAGTTFSDIADGENDIDMTIRPIIGETVTEVSIVERLADFKFNYDADELAGFTKPQMGIVVNDGVEKIFALNLETGMSDNYVNLPHGESEIKLKLYDSNIQRGRSEKIDESVTVTPGDPINIDIVPLHGETVFSLTEDGGDATFSFNLPAEIVDEAGGLENLQVQFSMVGDKNPKQEELLSLSQIDEDTYHAETVFSDVQYDTVTLSLQFIDSEVATHKELGSCVVNVDLDVSEDTVICETILRRRAIIGGNLLSAVGITVVDINNTPVEGAVIYVDGEMIGVTGGGNLTDVPGDNVFGTSNYLKLYLMKGDHTIKAVYITAFVEKTIAVSALGINNEKLQLNVDINDPSSFYGTSCQNAMAIGALNSEDTTGDGVYTIDIDGFGGVEPFDVYCDMTNAGGGWTLVLGPSMEFGKNSTFWDGTLGSSESFPFAGHTFSSATSEYLIANMPFAEMYLHFRTANVYESADGSTTFAQKKANLTPWTKKSGNLNNIVWNHADQDAYTRGNFLLGVRADYQGYGDYRHFFLGGTTHPYQSRTYGTKFSWVGKPTDDCNYREWCRDVNHKRHHAIGETNHRSVADGVNFGMFIR